MNMFTDPTIGPVLTVLFIICCLAGVVFLLMENWPKNKVERKPDARYENYMILDDGTIVYPIAVVDHINIKA